MGKKTSSSSSTSSPTVLGISLASARTSSSKAPKEYLPHDEIYSQILKYTSGREDETLISCLNKYLFQAKDFMYYYYDYPWKDFTNVRRAFHKLIQMQTLLTLLKGKYYLEISNEKHDEELSKVLQEDRKTQNSEKTLKKNQKELLQSQNNPSEDEASGISTHVIHIDFNLLKKTIKSTQRVDCSNFQSVMNIGKSIPSASKQNKNVQNNHSSSNSTIIQVIAGDCLETSIALKQKLNLNPLMLVNGSLSHPGGGYANGSFAQEEDMCRRSSLALCLDDPFKMDDSRQWSYPLPQFGGCYVPQCLVLRQSAKQGYAFLEQPVTISMFSMAAYMNPPVEKRSIGKDEITKQDVFEYFLDAKLANSMKQKIASLFEVALQKGHDSLVLSPIGCGAYANPSYHIACLFKEVLQSEFFRNKFKMVLISVIEDKNSMNNLKNMYESDNVMNASEGISNQKIFARVFHGTESGLKTLDEFLQDRGTTSSRK